jgi:hypothetical protein
MHYQDLIHKAYTAFNARDIDTALAAMHPEVQWPKAFEGGYVSGQPAVRAYWTRQWTEINPIVLPVEISERSAGVIAVTVHQTVHDLQGQLLFDGKVQHVYTLRDDLLYRMDIEAA